MIIKRWEHAGMTCALRHGFNDVPCGYVLIPDGHPLHGVGYNDADGAGIHAHGGLTFAGPIEGEDWWLGFDMGHYGDLDLSTLTPLRTDAECIAETEMLAEQLREWGQDEGENFCYEWNYMRPSDTTYRPDKVEPPAPKVLDADGEEIREGDVLYSVETGDYVIVDSIEPGNPWFAIADGALQHCAKFTHRAPVFAADGRPLRVGETVYEVGGDDTAYVFDGMSEYVDGLAMLHHDGKPYIGTGLRVGQLTHEQPETWERIEEDAKLAPGDYIEKRWRKTELHAYEEMPIDLVRRCRALAEKENINE